MKANIRQVSEAMNKVKLVSDGMLRPAPAHRPAGWWLPDGGQVAHVLRPQELPELTLSPPGTGPTMVGYLPPRESLCGVLAHEWRTVNEPGVTCPRCLRCRLDQ